MNDISNGQLLCRLESLVERECHATLAVLIHLNEIERRRLHLRIGYASMFDFAASA